MRHIMTAQAGAFRLALLEAGNPRVLCVIEPGIALCEDARVLQNPVFLRHICPVHAEVRLCGDDSDISALAGALSPLLGLIKSGDRFSVQTRIVGFSPAYKPFDVNTALCRTLDGTGAILDVQKPEKIISVMLFKELGWIGVSDACENLHDWAGGARRFKWEQGQISRAEFKLLEAIEQYRVILQSGMRALDLGAAPGGWTRVLRSKGLLVTAVDPADLDERLLGDECIRHVKSTSQAYFASPQPCDILVNDMKMDASKSAQIMAEGASCLRDGGEALLTMKLSSRPTEWPQLIRQAKAILSKRYEILHLRQLFHNRNEVMAHLRKI